jgi:hypothetical protein
VQLSAGTHSLRASFAGIAPFTNSTSAVVLETINRAATTANLTVEPITSDNEIVLLNAAILPVAPGTGMPTGTVTFFDGSTVLGTATLDATGMASLFIETLTPGKHTLTIVYSGDGNFQGSTSAPLVLTVS